jgi:DNA-binding transcriptional ArsR family regulator
LDRYKQNNPGVIHMTNWYTDRIRDLLSAVTHPSRVAILEFLSDRDFGTNKSLRQHLKSVQPRAGGDSPAVVTHHVSLLEKNGLVKHSEEDARVIVATALGRRITRVLRQMVSNSDLDESWDRSL